MKTLKRKLENDPMGAYYSSRFQQQSHPPATVLRSFVSSFFFKKKNNRRKGFQHPSECEMCSHHRRKQDKEGEGGRGVKPSSSSSSGGWRRGRQLLGGGKRKSRLLRSPRSSLFFFFGREGPQGGGSSRTKERLRVRDTRSAGGDGWGKLPTQPSASSWESRAAAKPGAGSQRRQDNEGAVRSAALAACVKGSSAADHEGCRRHATTSSACATSCDANTSALDPTKAFASTVAATARVRISVALLQGVAGVVGYDSE